MGIARYQLQQAQLETFTKTIEAIMKVAGSIIVSLAFLCAIRNQVEAGWTDTQYGCIIGYDDADFAGIADMEACKWKCISKTWCRSVEYNWGSSKCILSQADRSTASNYKTPCPTRDVTYSEQTGWTDTQYGCIIGYNHAEFAGIANILDCKRKCLAQSDCKSVEYHSESQMCTISAVDRSTVSTYRSPCTTPGWTYSEQIVD